LEGKYLHFQIEGESFAIPISVVEDIVPYSIVKNGAVKLKGAIISIIDIKEIFQFCKTEPTQKVIIVNNGEIFGIPVDNLVGVVVAENKEIDQDLAIRVFGDNSPITGIIKKSNNYIAIIDIGCIKQNSKQKEILSSFA
jgi:chemotaxis signal transduction protein